MSFIKDPNSQVTFVLINPSRASTYSFREYGDERGVLRYIDRFTKKLVTSEDPTYDCEKRGYWFRWKPDIRKIVVDVSRDAATADFLRNYPGTYTAKKGQEGADRKHFFISEVNDLQSANLAIDSERNLAIALGKVFELEGDMNKARKIAYVCGIDANQIDALVMHSLIQFARNNPSAFLEILDSPDTDVKALFAEAVDLKIIVRKGLFFMFGDQRLLQTEEKCYKLLSEDEELYDAIAYRVSLERGDSNAEEKPKSKKSK